MSAGATADPWAAAMRRGDFRQAWAVADQLLGRRTRDCSHWPRHLQHIWDGRPLEGEHVLVRCYHGLGDTIQFIRYIPLVEAVASSVTVWAQPRLLPLLRRSGCRVCWLPLHDGAPEGRYGAEVELMELPHVFRTELDTIPAHVPYLHPATPSAARRGRPPRVGIVWRGGDWDQRRNISPSMLAPLRAIGGVNWVVLQYEAASHEWGGTVAGWHPGLPPLECARMMCTLDLLVTIDSMSAHLGGALGIPTWTLLPFEADWRWMEDRTDSPWYPTMRLFRQRERGQWGPVIAEVAAALRIAAAMPAQRMRAGTAPVDSGAFRAVQQVGSTND